MITLPITCNQVWLIIAGVTALIGTILIFTNFWIIGMIILVLEALIAGCVGVTGLVIWIDDHVKCKCGK